VNTNKIKSKLLSLYSSSSPQVFTQLHGAYDEDRHKIDTETSRVYDLRAGAPLQILLVDGMTKELAIEFLEDAIRHIEVMGIPPKEAPVLSPDGTDVE
jgi:hypothetical protein